MLQVYGDLLPRGFICFSYVSHLGSADIIEAKRTP